MLKVHAQRFGDVTIICVEGGIVTGHITELANAVNSHSDVSALVLDLSRVSRVDARGLGAILELREQAQSKGIAFKLMNATKLVRRVLEISRLNSVFEFCSDQDIQSAVATQRPNEAVRIVTCAQAA